MFGSLQYSFSAKITSINKVEYVMYLVIHDDVSFVVDMRNYYILDNFPEGFVLMGIHLLHWERSQYNCFHESFYLFG